MSDQQPTGLWSMAVSKYPKSSLLMAVGGAVVVFVALAIFLASPKGTVLERIADIDYARGVLTFIIALGTVAIALILTVAAIVQSGDQAKERFSRGKEVLTALVGILGTIVGYYFGSAGGEEETRPDPAPQVQTVPAPAAADGGGEAAVEEEAPAEEAAEADDPQPVQ